MTDILVLTDIHRSPNPSTCFARATPAWQNAAIRVLHISDLLGVRASGADLHGLLAKAGGFEKAAKRLRAEVRRTDIALGYSAGGTVLWHAVLQGLPVGRLVCISSTRLRFLDPRAFPIPAHAVFGAEDNQRPGELWNSGVSVEMHFISGADHAFYTQRGLAWEECLSILGNIPVNPPP